MLALPALLVAACSTQGFVRGGWHVGSITLCYIHSDTRVASAVGESACISIEPDDPAPDDGPGRGLLLGRSDPAMEPVADDALACQAEPGR